MSRFYLPVLAFLMLLLAACSGDGGGADGNTAPSAQTGLSASLDEDTSTTITLAGTDADGDTLSYAISTEPAHGAVILSGNTATYTPAANFNGSDSFSFTVSDGSATSASATVALTVNPVNDAPVLSAVDPIRLEAGESLPAINLVVSDIDTPLDQITITASSGNQSVLADDDLTLTRTATGFALTTGSALQTQGSVLISLRISDGQLQREGLVAVEVCGALAPAIALASVDRERYQPGQWITVTGTGFDQMEHGITLKAGDQACPELDVYSATQLRAMIPWVSGEVSLVLSDLSGQTSNGLTIQVDEMDVPADPTGVIDAVVAGAVKLAEDVAPVSSDLGDVTEDEAEAIQEAYTNVRAIFDRIDAAVDDLPAGDKEVVAGILVNSGIYAVLALNPQADLIQKSSGPMVNVHKAFQASMQAPVADDAMSFGQIKRMHALDVASAALSVVESGLKAGSLVAGLATIGSGGAAAPALAVVGAISFAVAQLDNLIDTTCISDVESIDRFEVLSDDGTIRVGESTQVVFYGTFKTQQTAAQGVTGGLMEGVGAVLGVKFPSSSLSSVMDLITGAVTSDQVMAPCPLSPLERLTIKDGYRRALNVPMRIIDVTNGQTPFGMVVSAAGVAGDQDALVDLLGGDVALREINPIWEGSAYSIATNSDEATSLVTGLAVGEIPIVVRGTYFAQPASWWESALSFGLELPYTTASANLGYLQVLPAAVNQNPTISTVANQQCEPDQTVGPLTVTIADAETAAGDLTLTAVSNNLTLLPASGVVLGGTAEARTITLTPASGQTGTATVTLTVTDGEGETASVSFVLTVIPGGGGLTGTYLVIDVSGGSTASSYPTSELDAAPTDLLTNDAYKTTKIVLRRIPAGTFTMGSPSDELGRDSDETQHQVTLSQDFYVGVFEVTQAQWVNVMGSNPSYYAGDTRPVESVSWTTVRGGRWAGSSGSDPSSTSFMGVLRTKAGLVCDLPTEAQWEYACRAGTTTALNNGEDLSSTGSDANMDLLGRYSYNRGSSQHAVVGSYQPNAWGLYDMHGNVWEWCLDWYTSSYGSDAVTDPVGPASGSSRVGRGGSWNRHARLCRSAFRGNFSLGFAYNNLGFRLAAPGQPDGNG